MKGLFTTMLLVAAIYMSAQVPQNINYQAVARDATSGLPIANQTVRVQFVVHDSSQTGPVAFIEEYDSVKTNAYGLFDAPIGGGRPLQGTFSGINWASGRKYLQVLFSAPGTSVFTDMGATQLLSVPFALYAQSAGNG
jgi:hypothetical protein